jgi:hypothetical protein
LVVDIDQTNVLQLINVTDPGDPRLAGAYAAGRTQGNVMDVAAAGHYAYVVGDGLQVIDISSPSKPRRVGGLEGGYGHLAVANNYVYVVGNGFEVIDISDPASPRRAGACAFNGESTSEVAVSGNYAYLADRASLHVIDIADPTTPRRVGGLQASVGQGSIGLAAAGAYAYLAGGWYDEAAKVWRDGLQVIDVSDPANPQRIGGCDTSVSGTGVVVSGHHAFMHSWGRGGVVIDISDPAHAQQVGRYRTTGCVNGVAVSGSYLYLATSGDGQAFMIGEGLLVFDIWVLANPQRVGRYRTNVQADGVAVSGTFACVAGSWAEGTNWVDGLQVIDISNPADPRLASDYDASTWYYRVPTSTNFTYVPDPDEVWLVNDVSDPASPRQVGGYKTIASAFGVTVAGRYAYHFEGNLIVTDVSDPTSPHLVGNLETALAEPPWALALSGHYAYVVGSRYDGTNWIAGLKVIDVADPAHPRPLSTYETSGRFADVAVPGDYAYVAGDGGLSVIDVSDPAQPKSVGSYGGNFEAVAVSGTYAYLGRAFFRGSSMPHQNLEVLDISVPAHPRRVGGNSMCAARDLAVAGNLVFAAAGWDGLVILNTYQPPPRIESTVFDGDGFHLIFRGEAGRTIRLQRSSDLKTWEDWVILTATGESQEVADPSAGSHPCQFYRAVGQ